jgi:hypothetical protein
MASPYHLERPSLRGRGAPSAAVEIGIDSFAAAYDHTGLAESLR